MRLGRVHEQGIRFAVNVDRIHTPPGLGAGGWKEYAPRLRSGLERTGPIELDPLVE